MVQIEIDIGRILRALGRRWWALVLAAVVGACGCMIGAKLWISPRYTSSMVFYVSGPVDSPVDSAVVVLETAQTRREILAQTGINRTHEEIREWIRAGAVRTTDFLRVEVTAPDPVEAKVLVDGVLTVLPRRVQEIMGNVTVLPVDEGELPRKPSGLSGKQWAALGGILGMGLWAAGIVLGEISREDRRRRDG